MEELSPDRSASLDEDYEGQGKMAEAGVQTEDVLGQENGAEVSREANPSTRNGRIVDQSPRSDDDDQEAGRPGDNEMKISSPVMEDYQNGGPGETSESYSESHLQEELASENTIGKCLQENKTVEERELKTADVLDVEDWSIGDLLFESEDDVLGTMSNVHDVPKGKEKCKEIRSDDKEVGATASKASSKSDEVNKHKSDSKQGKHRKWKVPPPDNYRGFAGKDDVLSNFYPCTLYVYARTFSSTEHAYQWRKATFLRNEKAAEEILATEHANEAKRIANKHFGRADLSQWRAISVAVMRQLLRAKARCCEAFRNELRHTGERYIAEVVPRDRFWALADGTGKNVMGELLMSLRDHLDQALAACPDEDGKLIDFPPEDVSAWYTVHDRHKRAVLLIGDPQVADMDVELEMVCIDKVIKHDLKEVEEFVKNEESLHQSPIVLHVLSHEILHGHETDVLVENVSALIDEIRKKANDPDLILSLPVYAASSLDDEHFKRADAITGKLFTRFNNDNKVSCLRNALRLEQTDCFRKDGSLTDSAQNLFKRKLMETIRCHLFGTKHPKHNRQKSSRRKQKSFEVQKEMTSQSNEDHISQSHNSETDK